MAGLLGNVDPFDTGDPMGNLALIGGLLSARQGQNVIAPLLFQAAAMKQAQQKSERENRANELQQLSASYKILKDQDQEARDNALFSGNPQSYVPNPLLALHEQKLAQLMGAPAMTNGAGAQPPVNTSRNLPPAAPAPSMAAQNPPPMPMSGGSAMPLPQGQPQTQGQQPQQAQAPTNLPEMLRGAGIDPAIASAWARTPAGKNELFKKLADVYGPRVVNNVLMQLQPNGQTRFLGGAVGNDTLPVVMGPNGLQVQPIQGLQEARASQAGATTAATESAKAPYQMVTVPQPDGSTRMVPLSSLAGQAPQRQPSSGVASLSVSEPPRPGSGASFGVSQTPGDRAQQESLSKFHADTFIETQQAGKAAAGGLQKLDRIDQLLKDVDTGKLTPAGMNVAAYAQSLGLPIDPKLPNKQAAEALTGQIALELRNPSGGAGMPGALSDNDLKFLRSMTPGLAQTTEGRNIIIETKRKILQRDQEVAQLARQYRQKNGGKIDDTFLQALQDFSASHPLFMQQGGGSDIDALVNRYRTK